MQCVRVILPGTTTLNSWPNIVSLLWRPAWLEWLVDGATRRLGDDWSLGRSMSGPALALHHTQCSTRLGAFHFELYLLKCSPRSGKMETLNSVGATTIKLMASPWTWAEVGGDPPDQRPTLDLTSIVDCIEESTERRVGSDPRPQNCMP